MTTGWGIVGSGYMAREYCKALLALDVVPQIYARDLHSKSALTLLSQFPNVQVHALAALPAQASNWLVCTNIESHEDICRRLSGNIWCEKPYAHTSDYDATPNLKILMNRRYYYWVARMKEILESGTIVKVVACIPETGVAALIAQSIHVIDLLWYLVGPFDAATRIGDQSPSYFFTAGDGIPVVVNMNYGAHENFSLRFYADDGVVCEARPIEAFVQTEGMEVREPDDALPLRTYRPITRPLPYLPTGLKPGLKELLDDALSGAASRLPGLAEHRRIHVWMERNML